MKETIELIKKLWSNKKTRAISILIVYVIFFIFVFALINLGETGNKYQKEEEKTNVEDDFDISSISNYILVIDGEDNFTYDAATDLITYNDEIYLIEEIPEQLYSYDLDIFKPVNLDQLLQASMLKSTDHIEKSYTYLLKIRDFEKIIYNNEVENDDNIEIKIYEDNSKIIVDLTGYYGYLVNIELRD